MDQALGAACDILAPILQLHPTRRCNLRCLHCYSHSSPDEREELSFDTIAEVLTDAREQGYAVASFSGGEPILYRELRRCLSYAKSLGMRTTVTSNGMLLNSERLREIAGCTDVLAISLDGMPEAHDRMRAFSGAFERMAANLDAVRASGLVFGFIFTLTQHNVNEANWVAEFAVSQGARLLQIHPLEEVGRASETLPGARPDELESAYAFLEAERIRRVYGDRVFVQVDLFHRDLVARLPERFYADQDWQPPARLSGCITPLVLEAGGMVVPIGYGFARKYAVGNVRERRLRDLAPHWITRVYPQFRELCRRVYAEACVPSDLPFLNWYELLQLRAAEMASPDYVRLTTKPADVPASAY